MVQARSIPLALGALVLLGGGAVCKAASGEGAPRILSAFFGLDDALPAAVEGLCAGSTGLDGLPVVFDREIDRSTLDAADFRVYVGSGQGRRPRCATLRPASEEDEARTVLLIGDLADAIDDPPVGVEVVGELRAADGTSLRGARTEVVTPLEEGPFLVFAEVLAAGEGQLGTPGRGGGCPAESAQVVRVYWAGGVRAPDRSELGERERTHFRVVAREAAVSSRGEGAEGAVSANSRKWPPPPGPEGLQGLHSVVPFALGDLNDNDNVVDLCLERMVEPLRVEVDAGVVVDPRGDANPATALDLP